MPALEGRRTRRPRARIGRCSGRRIGRRIGPLLVLLIGLLSSPALAGKALPRGSEARVLELVLPHRLGEPIVGDVVLWGMQIDRDRVVFALYDPVADVSGSLVLRPRIEDDPEGSTSFSFATDGPPALQPAARALAEAVRIRDRGGLYVEVGGPVTAAGADGTGGPEGRGGSDRDPAAAPGGSLDLDVWSPAARRRIGAGIAAWGLVGFVLAGLGRRRLGRPTTAPDERSVAADALTLAAMIAALLVTAAYAWTCDDATISLRYAWNLVEGHGLVFNVGERVQGFTNPLWTMLLAVGVALGHSLPWAIGLGLAWTGIALVALAMVARRLGGPLGPAIAIAICFSCEPFVAFSTSGLEGAATHALVAAVLATAVVRAPVWAFFFAGVAVFNRLDTAPLLLPVLAVAWTRAGTTTTERWRVCRPGIVGGGLVLGGWLVAATLYYGMPLPNTWYAKGGLNLDRGASYLADFVSRRPASSVFLLAAPVGLLGLSRARGRAAERAAPELEAMAIGALVHVAYVVAVGGDYMHGRFFTPPMIPAALVTVALVRGLGASSPRRGVSFAVVVVASLAAIDAVRPPRPAPDPSVVIERDPEFSVWAVGPSEVAVTRLADPHSGRPRPLPPRPTISNHLIGQVFGTDPRIEWVDLYGLTDAYIARAPPEPDGRAGHELREVPRAYLRARGDVRQLPQGRRRLENGDPTLVDDVAALRADPRWPSETHRRVYEELEHLTRGPVWDPQRLRLIPRYVFGRRRLPRIAPEHRVGPDAYDP